MPATAIPGASLPTYPNYFARAQGGLEPAMNIGLLGNVAPTSTLPLSSNWSLAGTDQFSFQPSSSWPVGGNNCSGVVHAGQVNQLLASPKGWRLGDWMCSCGFHNYSSRSQCKKCNASMPPAAPSSFVSTEITALGTKRLATEELVQGWDSKRLNAGQQTYPRVEHTGVSSNIQQNIMSSNFLGCISAVAPNLQANLQAAPALLGKGAKQWRQGDWMCTNCNNHNYASRSQCNRCKTLRQVLAQPVGVA